MRRLLMIVPIAALAFASYAPVQANDLYPTQDTPIVFGCTGTGGYEDTANGPVWRHQNLGVDTVGRPCGAWSRDTAAPLSAPPVPSDPTDPVGTFDELFNWAFNLQKSSPAGTFGRIDKFSLVGDFACGSGILVERADGVQNQLRYSHGLKSVWWQVEQFDASFFNGAAQVTGTARNTDTGEIRDLTGTMLIDDGAAAGQCDDSAGAARVALQVVLTPQS